MKLLWATLSTLIVHSAAVSSPTINVPLDQYQQMQMAQMGNGGNCFNTLANSMNQGLTQSFSAYQNQANMLMQNADRRFQNLRDCRSELRQAWLDFQEKKQENATLSMDLPNKINRAKIEFEGKLLEIQNECRAQSNEEFAKYRERLYGSGPLSDPTQLVNFNNNINSHRETFYQNCYRTPENRRRVELLSSSLRLAISELQTAVTSSNEALNNFSEQIRTLQADTVRNCEEQKELQEYNERISASIAARGMSLARQQMALGMIGALQSCMDPGRVPAGSPTDTTRPVNPTTTSF